MNREILRQKPTLYYVSLLRSTLCFRAPSPSSVSWIIPRDLVVGDALDYPSI